MINELKDIYGTRETESMIRLIFEKTCGFGYTEFVLNRNRVLDAETISKIQEITNRLKKQEPIQYVLGECMFYGLPFVVNPDVLIPRPETEELVRWITESHECSKGKLLDIGTGSGCIAVALKISGKFSEVTGLDISEKALETARQNAARNNAIVRFVQCDIFNMENCHLDKFDVMVSNPPYVTEAEKNAMQLNVTGYEPHLALFVPDQNPLKYYIEIASFAMANLQNKGWLFFEINENFAGNISAMLSGMGFVNIEVKKDINGKNRMVKGQRP